jgi:hypothetical protein
MTTKKKPTAVELATIAAPLIAAGSEEWAAFSRALRLVGYAEKTLENYAKHEQPDEMLSLTEVSNILGLTGHKQIKELLIRTRWRSPTVIDEVWKDALKDDSAKLFPSRMAAEARRIQKQGHEDRAHKVAESKRLKKAVK